MISLLDRLSTMMPTAKRTTLRALIADGRVVVNGRLADRASSLVAPEDHVEIGKPPRPPREERGLPLASAGLGFAVVHDDDDLVVIDKPAGLLTSSTPREKRPTALGVLRTRFSPEKPDEKIRLIHRLDKDASGLIVFAKTPHAFEALKKQFYNHNAHRVYAAIVREAPRPAEGTIDNFLVEHADGTVHETRLHHKGERAVTHYKTTARNPGWTLLRVTLGTGRKHQIRAHLAGLGHPIAGDNLYDGPWAPRLMLAAVELRITSPAGKPFEFTLPLPHEMANLMRNE